MPAGDGRIDRSWIAPLLVAAAIRVACLLLLTPALPIVGDSIGYVDQGRAFLAEGRIGDLPPFVRPPLEQVFVALGLDADAEPPAPWPGVYLLQISCDLVACLAIMAVAARRFGRRSARAAGWCFALLPTAALYASTIVMAEAPAGMFAAVALLLLERLDTSWRRAGRSWLGPAVGLGLVLGAGMLLKELLLVVAAVFVAGLLLERSVGWGRRLAAAAIVGVLALALLLPWTVHTIRTYGVALPTGTQTYVGMLGTSMPDGSDGYAYWRSLPDYKTRVVRARQIFWGSLVDDPMLLARRMLYRLRVLLGPETTLPLTFAVPDPGAAPPIGAMEDLDTYAWRLPGWGGAVQWLTGVGTLLFFSLGVAGLAARPGGLLARTAVLLAAVLSVAVALTVALPRYRYGLIVFLAPFAGLALAALGGAGLLSPVERRRAWRAGLACAALLLLTLFVLPAPARVVP